MREHISKFSLFLAVISSVIGLGLIWRFPYLMGGSGGSAFLFLYLFAVIVLGVPLIFFELYLGQKYKTTIICLFREKLKKKWSVIVPGFLLLVSFGILTYYSVVTSWTLGYAIMLPFGYHTFSSYLGSSLMYIAFFLTLFLLYFVVRLGLNKGIDKLNKIAATFFVIFLIVLLFFAIKSLGFITAIKYFFNFDYSLINFNTIVMAFGHALFSLSLGLGILLTFSSYSDKENLNPTIYGVVIINILVSLIIGVIIYAFLFSFGLSETVGPSLIFNVLPLVFQNYLLFGCLFFVLVFLAGFTSVISLFELIISSLVDYFKIKRKKIDLFFICLLALFSLIPLLCPDSIETLDAIFGSYLTIFGAFLFLLSFLLFAKWFSPVKNRLYKIYYILLYVDLVILLILLIISIFIW